MAESVQCNHKIEDCFDFTEDSEKQKTKSTDNKRDASRQTQQFSDVTQTDNSKEICNVDVGKKNKFGLEVSIRPNSIFWTPSGEMQEVSRILARKSLAQSGFYPPPELRCYKQSRKKPVIKILVDMLRKGKYPDVIVRIGCNRYPCHISLLQCYSEFFKHYNIAEEIVIPEGFVSLHVFEIIYKWMLLDDGVIPYEHLVELFYASRALSIPELTKVCWSYFDCDSKHLREDQAFLLYLQARKYKLDDLQIALLQRVTRYFLSLVSSRDYVEMSLIEVVRLLSSNNIGVNTEVEVFLSALLWLNYDRKNREQYVKDVLGCVRFGIIPAWYLLQLQNKCLNSPEVEWVVEYEFVLNTIRQAMIYSVAHQHYANNAEGFVQWLGDEGIDRITERQYIFDKGCIYHHRLRCPHMNLVTYKMFTDYLDNIVLVGNDYWHCIEPGNADLGCVCKAPQIKPTGANNI